MLGRANCPGDIRGMTTGAMSRITVSTCIAVMICAKLQVKTQTHSHRQTDRQFFTGTYILLAQYYLSQLSSTNLRGLTRKNDAVHTNIQIN